MVSTELYLALNKGGYLNWDNQLVASDTQFSLQVLEGSQIRNAVGHLIGAYQVDINDGNHYKVSWAGRNRNR